MSAVTFLLLWTHKTRNGLLFGIRLINRGECSGFSLADGDEHTREIRIRKVNAIDDEVEAILSYYRLITT